MVVRPDSDVERALKAFGDLSLKYRSFGAIPLRLGGTSITGQSGVPSLDGMGFDTMGTDAPSTAADTYPLLGSALAEARDVPVAPAQVPRATGYGSGYPASVTWQAPPPPASLTEQALGRAVVPDPAPPVAYMAAPAYRPAPVYVPAPAPTTVYVLPVAISVPASVPDVVWSEPIEPDAVVLPGPAPAPAVAATPLVERPSYAAAPLPRPAAPMETLPTIFSHMRAAASEPEVLPEPAWVPPSTHPVVEPLPPLAAFEASAFEPPPVVTDWAEPEAVAEPIAAPPLTIDEVAPVAGAVPVAGPAVAPMRAGLARRGPPAQKQPLAGLFRSLAHPEPAVPLAEPDAPGQLAP